MKYTLAVIVALGSLVINLWILNQQRKGNELDPVQKRRLESLSYGLIVVAVLIMTFM